MRVAQNVNADSNQVAVMNTGAMTWESTDWPGISRKVLEFVNHPRMGRETALLKFAPGAALPETVLTERMDLFVVQGIGRGNDNGVKGQGQNLFHAFKYSEPKLFTDKSARLCRGIANPQNLKLAL